MKKQRLSIARPLLKEKKILLLDEVTSSLDHDTAVTIKILLSADQTNVFMITHNLRNEILSEIAYKIKLILLNSNYVTQTTLLIVSITLSTCYHLDSKMISIR